MIGIFPSDVLKQDASDIGSFVTERAAGSETVIAPVDNVQPLASVTASV